MNGAVGGPQEQHIPGTSEPLQLTQLLGSEAEQQVLLTQPKVHIIARAKMPRGDRLVSWGLLDGPRGRGGMWVQNVCCAGA
jgi:hypothetical protein